MVKAMKPVNHWLGFLTLWQLCQVRSFVLHRTRTTTSSSSSSSTFAINDAYGVARVTRPVPSSHLPRRLSIKQAIPHNQSAFEESGGRRHPKQPEQQQVDQRSQRRAAGAVTTLLAKALGNWAARLADPMEATGLRDVRYAGIRAGKEERGAADKSNKKSSLSLWGRVKRLHNPKTYLVLSLLAGLKWDWCFRSPYYWFGVAFCVKWYRARYVFKIPVWDRQPNWNNIITSKEQEKDLKAFTCKNCGSTLFIAKSREFFFEGGTGIGGLGCFSCGAKGKDNFAMDRDRIVEDVADVDDYFEYERPLDFVSAAERRKLLKESGGDEEKANLLLLERTTGIKSEESTESAAAEPSPSTEAPPSPSPSPPVLDAEIVSEVPQEEASTPIETKSEAPPPVVNDAPRKPPKKATSEDDEFDLLGMDG